MNELLALSEKYKKYIFIPTNKRTYMDLIWPLNFIAYIKCSSDKKNTNKIEKLIDTYMNNGDTDEETIYDLDKGIMFIIKNYLGNQDTIINRFKYHRTYNDILKEYNKDTCFIIDTGALVDEICKTVSRIKDNKILYTFATKGYTLGLKSVDSYKSTYNREIKYLGAKRTNRFFYDFKHLSTKIKRLEKELAKLEDRDPNPEVYNKDYTMHADPIYYITKDIYELSSKIKKIKYDKWCEETNAEAEKNRIINERKAKAAEELRQHQIEIEKEHSRLIKPYYYKRKDWEQVRYLISEFTENEVGGNHIYEALRKANIYIYIEL